MTSRLALQPTTRRIIAAYSFSGNFKGPGELQVFIFAKIVWGMQNRIRGKGMTYHNLVHWLITINVPLFKLFKLGYSDIYYIPVVSPST
jgi:hypothetical protein